MALTQTFLYTKRGSVACPISIPAPDSFGTTKLRLTIELGTSAYRGRLSSEAVLVPGQSPDLGGEAGVYWRDLGRFTIIGTATEINLVLATLVYHADPGGAETPTIPASVVLNNFADDVTRATGTMTLQPKLNHAKVTTQPIFWVTPFENTQRFQRYTPNASSKSFNVPAFTQGSVVSYLETWTPKAVTGRHQYLSIDAVALATLPSGNFTLTVDYHGVFNAVIVSKADGAAGILNKIAAAIQQYTSVHGIVCTSFTSDNKPYLRIERFDQFDGSLTNILNFTTDPTDVLKVARQDGGNLSFLIQETGKELFSHGETVHGKMLDADLERAAGRWAIDGDTGALAWKCYAVRSALNAYHDTVRFRPTTDYSKTGRFELKVTDRHDGTLTQNINFYASNYFVINGNQSYTVIEGTTKVPVTPMHIVGPEFSDCNYTVRFTMSNVNAAVISSSGTGVWHPPANGTPGFYEATNTLRNINRVMRTFAISVPAESPDSFTVTLTVLNDIGQSAMFEIKVKMILPPTAPTLNNAGIIHNWTEDQTYSFAPAPSIHDVNADDTLTVTATLSHNVGALSSTAGGAFDADLRQWSITGLEPEVNAALAALSFVPTTDADTNFTINLTVADQTNLSASGVLTMNCTAIADASIITAPTTVTYLPDMANNPIAGITITDPDTADTCSMSIGINKANAGTFGGLPLDSYNGQWVYNGTPTALAGLISGLTFTPTVSGTVSMSNANRTHQWTEDTTSALTPAISITSGTYFDQSFQISIAYTDNTGTVQSRFINANPAPYTVGDATVTLTIPAAAGTLSASPIHSTATSSSAVVGANRILTIRGQVAHVNAILATVSFVPATNYDLNFNIAISTPAGNGSIVMACTKVNDEHTVTNLSGTYSYEPRGGQVVFPNMVITDPDDGQVLTARMVLSNIAAGDVYAVDPSLFDAETGIFQATRTRTELNAELVGVTYRARPRALNVSNLSQSITWTEDTEYPFANKLVVTGSEHFHQSFTITTQVVDVSTGGSTKTGTITMNPLSYTPDLVQASFEYLARAGTLVSTTTLPTGATLTTEMTGSEPNPTRRAIWTGTEAQINSILDGLKFVPTANATESFLIAVTITVGGETRTGTIDMYCSAVLDAPIITLAGNAVTYDLRAKETVLPLIEIATPDAYNESLTVSLSLSDPQAGQINTARSNLNPNNEQYNWNPTTGTYTFTGDTVAANYFLSSYLPRFEPKVTQHLTEAGLLVPTTSTIDYGAIWATFTKNVSSQVIPVPELNSGRIAYSSPLTVTIKVKSNLSGLETTKTIALTPSAEPMTEVYFDYLVMNHTSPPLSCVLSDGVTLSITNQPGTSDGSLRYKLKGTATALNTVLQTLRYSPYLNQEQQTFKVVAQVEPPVGSNPYDYGLDAYQRIIVLEVPD